MYITDDEIVAKASEKQQFIDKVYARFGDNISESAQKMIDRNRRIIDELLNESVKPYESRKFPWNFDEYLQES